jgi:molecular chaperone GrpE
MPGKSTEPEPPEEPTSTEVDADEDEGEDEDEGDLSFGLDIADDLLAAALDSVDRHLGGGKKEIDVELPEDGAPEAKDRSAETKKLQRSLRKARRAARIQKLKEESTRLRQDKEKLTQQVTKEKKARLKAGAAVPRLQESLRRAQQGEADAHAARDAAESLLDKHRDAVAEQRSEIGELRGRLKEEAGDHHARGVESALDALLPVGDTLALALAHVDSNPEGLLEGVRMTLGQWEQALAHLGATPVDATPGTAFDPQVHEAIARILEGDHEPGTIVELFQDGYLLEGRLLRAARVSVAGAPTPDQALPEEE